MKTFSILLTLSSKYFERHHFSPLVPDSRNIYRIAKIRLKETDLRKKKFCEHRVYESVDDKSLSWAISQ